MFGYSIVHSLHTTGGRTTLRPVSEQVRGDVRKILRTFARKFSNIDFFSETFTT